VQFPGPRRRCPGCAAELEQCFFEPFPPSPAITTVNRDDATCAPDRPAERPDEPDTDIALMLRVRDAGDTAAFSEIAARYRTSLRRFFASLLADAAEADDGAQETLLRLWQSRERYLPGGTFSAYLFQIARHHVMNRRARYRFRAAHEAPAASAILDGALEIALPASSQPEMIVIERLERERLQQAVEALPAIYRSVFMLCHVNEWKYAEAACHLGIPVGTVKSRLFEAVRRVRVSLTAAKEEEEQP
jgi:RNA polymerase sigma-70 factor (ECF subfamily)